MTEEQIGRCVRIAMATAGLNILELAAALDVSRQTAGLYPKGKIDSISKLAGAAKACGMTYEAMMKLGDSDAHQSA